ncbi:MAG: hypothetical protein GY854_12200 [Deltaproteobacteria bacterium]|nr:hypothetical protein [Deltaproteobacteria bacterium]
MKRHFVIIVAALFVASICYHPSVSEAADTVETWDKGATDLDFYLGFDGIGLDKYEKSIYGDIMLGYGLIDRFSAYLGTTLQANEYFSDGSGNVYLGVFGTPVETDHFDLDLFLDISLGGPDFNEFQVAPSIELNLDLDPEMRTFGFYIRAGSPIYGHDLTTEEEPDIPRYETTLHIETTIGAYYTIVERHQIFGEYDMGFHPNPIEEEHTVDVGGVALGYNVTLSDAIELINQVYLDIPQDGEDISFGVMAGFIVTMPH